MSSPLIASYPQQLTQRFRRMILSGKFQPGERLREIPLAEEFGVSRGPIRDTFLQLTREGLLVAKPNAGVRVADPPSPFKRKSLVTLRRRLECDCLKEADLSDAGKLLKQLEANLEQYRFACEQEDLEAVVEIDMAFHHILVESADMGSMLTVWIPVISQIFLKYSRHQSLMESYHEHEAIVDALRDQDITRAAQLLREHIV